MIAALITRRRRYVIGEKASCISVPVQVRMQDRDQSGDTIQYSFIRSCQNAATYNNIEREKYVENENVKMVHNE